MASTIVKGRAVRTAAAARAGRGARPPKLPPPLQLALLQFIDEHGNDTDGPGIGTTRGALRSAGLIVVTHHQRVDPADPEGERGSGFIRWTTFEITPKGRAVLEEAARRAKAT